MAEHAAEGAPDISEEQAEKATSLLDIRKIIGGLMGVYGLLLWAPGCSRARRRRTRPPA